MLSWKKSLTTSGHFKCLYFVAVIVVAVVWPLILVCVRKWDTFTGCQVFVLLQFVNMVQNETGYLSIQRFAYPHCIV